MKSFESLWDELDLIIKERPSGSNTVKLVDAGIHEIGKKIIEEAGEVWLAAEHQSNQELAGEIAQLIYHLQVIAKVRGLTLAEIYQVL